MSRFLMFGVLFLLGLGGCASMKVEDFAGAEPRFVLEEYFAGHTRAWGIFEDRFGNLRRQFVVDIDGSWDGKVLTLDEHFLYSDGERQRRVWKLTKSAPGTYEGRAADVVGPAVGHVAGNALYWTYQVDMPISGRTWRVTFDDWMFLQPGGALINKADISKLGVRLGTVSIFFMHPAGAAPAGDVRAGAAADGAAAAAE